MQARTGSDVMPNSATFIADSTPIFTRSALLWTFGVQAWASTGIVPASVAIFTSANAILFSERFSFRVQLLTGARIVSSALAIRATATTLVF